MWLIKSLLDERMIRWDENKLKLIIKKDSDLFT